MRLLIIGLATALVLVGCKKEKEETYEFIPYETQQQAIQKEWENRCMTIPEWHNSDKWRYESATGRDHVEPPNLCK